MESNLARKEFQLFRQLQQRAYADSNVLHYVPLMWARADACIHYRDCALVYDLKRKRYLFLAYILDALSRHRRVLNVNSDLFDVNNPTVKLKPRRRSSTAMLFELEFSRYQQAILDQAREDVNKWKMSRATSAGSIRSARLQTRYSHNRHKPWFEVQLAIGIKPSYITQPEHVVGVHVNPLKGWFVTVLALNGVIQAQFPLDELAIATWLDNKDPAEQARIPADKRATKERHHRLADALVAICKHFRAQLGVEDIGYRTNGKLPGQKEALQQSTRSVTDLVQYKLARANLPMCVHIKNLSPKRDCSQCGRRHTESQVSGATFRCSSCGQDTNRYLNSARETARRVLWMLARKSAPQFRSANA